MKKHALWSAVMFLAACAANPESEFEGASDEDPDRAEALALLDHGDLVDRNVIVDSADESSILASDQDDDRHVIGADNRKPVTNTAVAPYASVALLLIKFRGMAANTAGLCTGTLIAPDAVLTAAHCLQDTQHYDGVASKVAVIPGAYADKNGKQSPLTNVGIEVVGRDALHIAPGFNDLLGYDASMFKYDYAVIRLRSPLGSTTGVRPLAIAPKGEGSSAAMIAYHSDRCAAKPCSTSTPNAFGQFTSAGSVRKVHDGIWFEHAIDMVKGASGAGISSTNSANSPLFAINIAQDSNKRYNVGLMLNNQNLSDIKRWAGL